MVCRLNASRPVGTILAEDIIHIANALPQRCCCGATMPGKAIFCGACGAQLRERIDVTTKSDTNSAFVAGRWLNEIQDAHDEDSYGT